ncbi:hypothetical protein F5X68DRAFT_202447 [Plectosphaerella plurivora]|uniref:C3H1-type domain-containing protein n=1 Tax=Plectosphaerella plurivora TaxID=936078 RepID=A0A9P8VJ11_9PEZI|nr:hypothetical protein F5X68DRAFT_202447 [Plectosphaerella plurivora]
MSSEDQELLAKIGQLAGKINRHKSRQAPSTPNHHPAHHRDNASRRGSGFQHRVGRAPAPHRHRTLVMNHSGTSTPISTTSDTAAGPSDGTATATSWVAKNSRHRQLINTAVYQKDNESRAKAIEATRKQQIAAQNARETEQISSHLTGQRGPTNTAAPNHHEVMIQGIRFRVTQRGSKLIKVPGDINPPSATPKITFVGGVKFHRSKNGNLYRDGILKAQRQTGIKKVNEPCRTFASTGNCLKGPTCRFIHDASRVAVCKDFLHKGECAHGDACDMSHDLTPQRVPLCLHYAKGNCAKFECRYSHQDLAPGAPVCRAFGVYGYCDAGRDCLERHVAECPDFSNTGKCTTRGCKLLHRERASVLRKTAAAAAAAAAASSGAGGQDDEMGNDLSSDEESADSDDVDSDEVEEFLGNGVDEGDDSDFVVQRDFIEF